MTMRAQVLLLFLSIGLAAGDWNILSYLTAAGKRAPEEDNNEKVVVDGDGNPVAFNLKQYCESWRMNVELNNIRGFEVVPGECVDYVGEYMTSTQYNVDIQRAAEEIILFLTDSFQLAGDGKDAWVFDVNDVLLSTVPFYKQHQFGGIKTNTTTFEEWVKEADAPAVAHMVNTFHLIRARGLKVFIISSRAEYLREATVDNLINAGYHGWTELILRCAEDNYSTAENYKAVQRGKLVHQGYRLWGIVGSQWSSLGGYTTARRIFKLPNPMYYEY